MKRTVLAALLALAPALSAHAEEPKPPLRVGYVQALANAPVLVAERKGFFKAEGLDVELKGLGDGPVIQQAVAGGEIDVAYVGAPPVYQWAARGLDARILAKVNYGQAALVAKADGPVWDLAGLKGRKVAGVAKGSGMDVLLRGFVLGEKAGLDPDADVQLSQLPVANMNGALDRGIVDAAFMWEPFVSQSVLRGAGRVVLDVNEVLPGYPWYVVAAPMPTLEARPDDLVRLLRAHAKAIAFLNEHPDEADRIVAQSLRLEAVTGPDGRTVAPEAVVAEARKRLGWSATLEASDRDFIQRLADYSVALGFLSKRIDVAALIDDDFAARAATKP